MRAAVLHTPGPPSAFSIEDVPLPVVEADEVLIKVERCGVSSRDVLERNGTYRRDVTYPLVMGLEIGGTVEACGSGVTDLRVGDQVCTKAFSSCGRCRLCRNGRETTCRLRRPVRGGYAEYAAIAQDAVVKVPAAISAEASCSLGPAAGVALNAVRDTARITFTDQVLVTGASGGVGSACTQIAKLAGARVIAVTRSAVKIAALEEDGANDVIVLTPGLDLASHVLRLTHGQGVDVVLDNVGSAIFASAFRALAAHGRYVLIGELSGAEASINLARIFFKRAQLLGVGSVSRSQLEEVIGLTAAGRLRPRVARTFPLIDVAQAHALVESGEAVGRVLLAP